MMPPALRATSPASPLRKSRLPRLTGEVARRAGGGKPQERYLLIPEIFENGLRGLPPPPRKTAHLPRKTGRRTTCVHSIAASLESALAARVAEDDAIAARGPQLRAQRVRVRPAFFRDPDDEIRGPTPAAVDHQRQPVAQDGSVLAAQPLVGGQHTSFGPAAGKLDTPRPPGRAGT